MHISFACRLSHPLLSQNSVSQKLLIPSFLSAKIVWSWWYVMTFKERQAEEIALTRYQCLVYVTLSSTAILRPPCCGWSIRIASVSPSGCKSIHQTPVKYSHTQKKLNSNDYWIINDDNLFLLNLLSKYWQPKNNIMYTKHINESNCIKRNYCQKSDICLGFLHHAIKNVLSFTNWVIKTTKK